MPSRLTQRHPDVYDKRDDSNLDKLYQTLEVEIDDLIDNASRIKKWRDVDEAEGVALDRLGRMLGEPRQGRRDSEYRQYIKMRIVRNQSPGDIETINEVLEFLMGDNYVGLEEGWLNDDYGNEPASIIITAENLADFVEQRELSDTWFLNGKYNLDGEASLDAGRVEIDEAALDELLEAAEEVVAAGVKVYWEIPRWAITDIFIRNHVTYAVNQLAEIYYEPANEVRQIIVWRADSAVKHRLEGQHLLNGEWKLDSKRDYPINRVNVEEVS